MQKTTKIAIAAAAALGAIGYFLYKKKHPKNVSKINDVIAANPTHSIQATTNSDASLGFVPLYIDTASLTLNGATDHTFAKPVYVDKYGTTVVQNPSNNGSYMSAPYLNGISYVGNGGTIAATFIDSNNALTSYNFYDPAIGKTSLYSISKI